MDKISLDTIKPNDRNPRTITGEAFRRLCESIKRDPAFMALRPIVVDAEGIILGGNMRYRACLHLGMTEVPASWIARAEDLTPEQRKRFVLIDNAPDGMAGEWDWDILAADWEVPELEEIGFDVSEMEPISLDDGPRDAGKDKELTRCPKCGFEYEVEG